MLDQEHLSFSRVGMYLKCGEQFNRRYVKGEIAPPSGSLARGSCGHKALEVNFRQKVSTREDLPGEAIKDAYADSWEAKKYEIAWSDTELKESSPGKLVGRYKDTGIGLVSLFHKELSPSILPVSVEEKITVEFNEDIPPLLTILDRIDEADVVGQAGGIGEVKFTAKSPPANDAATDLQLTVYDFAYRVKYGRPPQVMRKQWAVDLKTQKIVEQVVEARADEQITRMLHRLWAAYQGMNKGIFQPAAAGSWWCAPNWCGYWRTCKFHP